MVWVSSAAPAKSMRTASTPDKSEIMVWGASAAPAKSMRTASTPDKSEIRMAWVSTAAPATEHADCLCSSPFPVKSPSSLVVWAPDLLVMSSQKSSLSHPVMNGFSYLYYDTENLVSLIPLSTASCTCTMMQRVCLFRPVVRYLCNAFRCMNRSPVTPLFTVFSSCHIVKLGNKSHGHLSTLGIRFVLSFSLRSVACLKLSIKSHSHVSIVGICLGNAISLCYSVFVFVSYYVHSIGLVSLAFSFVVSLGFSPILSLVLSLVLSVLQCLIPAFFSRSCLSS